MAHNSGPTRGGRPAPGRTRHPARRLEPTPAFDDDEFDDDGFDGEPVGDLTTEPSAERPPEVDRIVLFSLDDKDYYVPAKIGPNVALAYMRDIRRHGIDNARAGILERILGREALDALADYDALTEEDLEAVMKAVDKHVLGPLEKAGKGSGFVLKKSGG